MATKYSCDIHTEDGWESIALFSDKVSLDAMQAFAWEQFERGNSLSAPCDSIVITDMDTGEILWDSNDAVDYGPDDDDYDEMGFDPYEGCYTYDC